ncbi:hypothetical protein [Georgenia yuyongxinii]
MSADDVARQLLELERAREARRKRRNRWLTALVVVAVLFGAFALWGITSQRAANDRMEDRGRVACLNNPAACR